MGKNIKSYATTQVHSPGKGRVALREKVLNLSFKIRYDLTVHIIRFKKKIFTGKIFKIVPSSQIPANYTNSAQFAPHSPRIMQNSHILLTYSILCFRHLPRQRTLENSSELRRFRMIRPHSPRITRIPHTSHYN